MMAISFSSWPFLFCIRLLVFQFVYEIGGLAVLVVATFRDSTAHQKEVILIPSGDASGVGGGDVAFVAGENLRGADGIDDFQMLIYKHGGHRLV